MAARIDPKRLAGRRALVTGASNGIGRAIAVRFAAEGAVVAINYASSPDGAETTLEAARAASRAAGHPDDGHCTIGANVAEPAEVEALFAEALTRLGGLDVLVNNAGIQSEHPSETLPLEEYRRVIDVNLTGAVLSAQAAVRHFLTRPGGGAIVNCSSVHQIIPKPGYLAYSVSKGGLGNLTRTLALEYAGRGIRVNAVGPGAIVTPINRAWIDDPERRGKVESHIPMGRAGQPEEIAAVFAFLASDEASYITGQTLYACGGLTLFGEFRENWAS